MRPASDDEGGARPALDAPLTRLPIGGIRRRWASSPTLKSARARAERLLQNPWLRLAVAALLVAFHVLAATTFARERYGLPFNSAPGSPPAFVDPAKDIDPQNARRLIVSRWDAGHYLTIAMRGYTYCPQRLTQDEIGRRFPVCNLSFYPGYSLMGRAVRALLGLPIDYALWVVSLLCTATTMFLFTGPQIVSRLGVWTTYAALLVFNAWPGACHLVMMLSEPPTVVFTLASFVALLSDRWWLAALLCGAASGMRISGMAASMALSLAIGARLLTSPPVPLRRRIGWLLLVPTSAWGFLLMVGYDAVRFGDPLVYFHSQTITHHPLGPAAIFHPRLEWLLGSVNSATHDGVWLVAILLWLLAAHRLAFRRFPARAQVFIYALIVSTLALAVVGSIALSLRGITRYVLAAFPIFFVIGAGLSRKPLALALWLAVSVWSYEQFDLCDYLGHVAGCLAPR